MRRVVAEMDAMPRRGMDDVVNAVHCARYVRRPCHVSADEIERCLDGRDVHQAGLVTRPDQGRPEGRSQPVSPAGAGLWLTSSATPVSCST